MASESAVVVFLMIAELYDALKEAGASEGKGTRSRKNDR